MQTMKRDEVVPVLNLNNFKHIIRIKPRPMTMDELERRNSKRRKETNTERVLREMKEAEQKNPPYRKLSNQL